MTKWTLPQEKIIEPKERNYSSAGRICRGCGYPIKTHRQKIWNQWVCDLALLDDGHWIHVNRIYEEELKGRRVVFKLYENV